MSGLIVVVAMTLLVAYAVRRASRQRGNGDGGDGGGTSDDGSIRGEGKSPWDGGGRHHGHHGSDHGGSDQGGSDGGGGGDGGD